ncbi:hypothetical protein, partial [Neisseria sicca]|uniref:hypothetical protein n=1 Tax=Neisseria sicca TaxID=490 RepID=UPI00055BE8D4
GGSAGYTNLILPKSTKPPPSQPSPAGRGKGQVAVAAIRIVGFAHDMSENVIIQFRLSEDRFRGQSPRYKLAWIK